MRSYLGGRLRSDPWPWSHYPYPAYWTQTGPNGIPSTDRRRVLPIQIVLQGIGSHKDAVVPSPARFTGPHRIHPTYATSRREPLHGGQWRPPSAYDRARNLARLFVLHSEEEDSVRTFLETAYGLLDLLSGTPDNLFSRGVGPNLAEGCQAQLDLLIRSDAGPFEPPFILSIWFGSDQPPINWSKLVRQSTPWDAMKWVRIGFVGEGLQIASGTDDEGRTLLRKIREAEGTESLSPRALGLGGVFPKLLLVGAGATCNFPPAYHPALRLGADPYANPPNTLQTRSQVELNGHQTEEFTMWDWAYAAPGQQDVSQVDQGQRTFTDLGFSPASLKQTDLILLIDDIEATLGPIRQADMWSELVRQLEENPRMTIVATTRRRETALFLTRQFPCDLLVGGRQPVRICAK